MNKDENILPEKAENENQKTEDVKKTIASPQIIEELQAVTTNQQALTRKMEVHHHPDLHHKKKKFKEYFFEFLMIFLAVTMGFIAENIREHISEKQRENEYINSLVRNLQDDTINLKRLIRADAIEKGVDSLLRINKSAFSDLAVQDSMYYYSIEYLTSEQDFKQNDFTIIQLRNAGGYRLIQKDHVADSIAAYEAKNNDIRSQANYFLEAFTLRFRYFNQTFDWTAASKFFKKDFPVMSKLPDNIPVLVTKDKEKIDLYYNQCYELAITYQGYKNMLKAHLEYLTGFISFLKKEYNLKE